METVEEEIRRLNFEDLLLIVFIILSTLNMFGNQNEKIYVQTKDNVYKNRANRIFEFTIIVTLIIYLYFFKRNYDSYNGVSEDKKGLYRVKVFGSLLLIVGTICLFYFQKKQTSFIGSPSL